MARPQIERSAARPALIRMTRSKNKDIQHLVLQYCQMSNTLTIRLPEELLERLRKVANRNGLPVGQVVRESLEKTLSGEEDNLLLRFAGAIKGGPSDLSSRKGFSRK